MTTRGFSKKVENHAAMVSLHFMYYNFGRGHKSLANPYPRTPAMLVWQIMSGLARKSQG